MVNFRKKKNMSDEKNLVIKPIPPNNSTEIVPLDKPQFLKELSSNIAAMNQLITDCKEGKITLHDK